MPIDVKTPQSAGWWLERLSQKLTDKKRQARLELLNDWFVGDPPLPVGAENSREAYQAFQRSARSNFAELVVEALRERMTPVGIRTSADGDETGDAEAWRIWQRAGLEVEAAEVHRTALSLGDAYVIVGPVDPDSGVPVITAEDPRQVVTEHDPLQQRRVVAALKMFYDDLAERELAYLYLPGRVYVAEHLGKRGTVVVTRFNGRSWSWDEDKGGADGQELPDGMMPVIRFRNSRGVGEFEPHLDLLARINTGILNRMTIAVMQAFRQRAAKNLPETDSAGNVIDYSEIFAADPGALWQLPEGVEMWESQQTDLTPILSAVKDDVQHLAAVTRTPMHMLMPAGDNQSAEGASLQREGLTFKADDRIARFTPGWSQVMATAFRWMNDKERADLNALNVLWKPPERLSLAERADASVKAKADDVPWRTRMTKIWGFSPDEVDRMAAERASDAVLARLTAPPAPPADAPTAGVGQVSGADVG